MKASGELRLDGQIRTSIRSMNDSGKRNLVVGDWGDATKHMETTNTATTLRNYSLTVTSGNWYCSDHYQRWSQACDENGLTPTVYALGKITAGVRTTMMVGRMHMRTTEGKFTEKAKAITSAMNTSRWGWLKRIQHEVVYDPMYSGPGIYYENRLYASVSTGNAEVLANLGSGRFGLLEAISDPLRGVTTSMGKFIDHNGSIPSWMNYILPANSVNPKILGENSPVESSHTEVLPCNRELVIIDRIYPIPPSTRLPTTSYAWPALVEGYELFQASVYRWEPLIIVKDTDEESDISMMLR